MNNSLTIELPTEETTISLAGTLADFLSAPLVLAFRGDIGAGKTTFIRAMLRALGVKSAIKSPTFSLVESYQTENLSIHHFDLYRIHDESELEYIGFRDYFSDNAVCCIEWPEHAPHSLDRIDMLFSIITKGEGRELCITTSSPVGKEVLNCLAASK